MSAVDDAKAAVAQAQEALTAASTVLNDVEGDGTTVDKTVTSVTINYSDGTFLTIEDAPPVDTSTGTLIPPTDTTPSDTVSDSGSSVSSDTPADSGSGEPVAAPEPVAAGTIPQ